MPPTPTIIPSDPRVLRSVLRFAPVVVITSLALALTLLLWQQAAERERSSASQEFRHQVDTIQRRVQDQIAHQVLLLRSARAHFEASERVTRDEWRRFVETSGLVRSGSGITGMAYVRNVDPGDDDELVREMRGLGVTGFAVQRDEFEEEQGPQRPKFVVCYNEPEARNIAAIGFDVGSREVNRRVYEEARDRNEIRVSGPLVPVQSTDGTRAVIIAAPLYKPGMAIETVTQRRDAIRGWVAGVVDLEAFLGAASDPGWDRYRVSLIDCRGGLVFETPTLTSEAPDCEGCSVHEERRARLGGYASRWILSVSPRSHDDAFATTGAARASLLGGVAVSALLAILMLTIARTQIRAERIAHSMTATLTKSERRMRQAESIAGLGHWDWDMRSGALTWSDQVYTIFGAERESFVATYDAFHERVHPDDAPLVTESIERTARGEADFTIDYRIVVPSGEIRWVHAQGEIARDSSGEPRRMFGVIQDITERREALEAIEKERRRLHESEEQLRVLAAEAREASEAKSRFLANMSHEIRTPMTAIIGYSEVLSDHLEENDRDSVVSVSLTAIKRAGQHLLAIINDVLDLSKIESGHVGLQIEATDLPRLVADVVEEMRVRADQKGLRLEAAIEDEIPDRVMTDQSRVRQILINLVGNAVKFTEAGRVVVRLGAEDQTLRIDVEDTGPGIEPETIPRLFNSFEQGDSSPTRQHEGTGLGLTICKSLCQLLGGDIRASSRVGYGSTFSVRLPLLACPGAKSTSYLALPDDEPGEVPASTGDLSGRVLVVEDGPDNRRLIAHLLERHALKVEMAEHGQIALDRIASGESFDLIVMDMQMPVLDGYETVRSLRAAGVNTPILALTAHAMTGDRERCLEAGCDGYLPKPIDRHRLVERVAALLERRADLAAERRAA